MYVGGRLSYTAGARRAGRWRRRGAGCPPGDGLTRVVASAGVSPRGRRPAEQTKVRTKIAAWRVKRGMTQAEAAEASHMSHGSYWNYEAGLVANPGIRWVASIAHTFGCELEDLIEDSWRRGWHHDEPVPSHLWRNPDDTSLPQVE